MTRPTGPQVGEGEEDAENAVGGGGEQDGWGGAAGEDQGGGGEDEGEFLQDGREHGRAEADRVAGDQEEEHLEGDGDADEAVEELGVGDGRWVVAADGGF